MQNPPDKSELAEVKEALGRLYKRIEETEAASKEQREKDRQVLNLWAETNLVQTELLSKQTKLIDQLTQELQKNETFWQKFARSSADLMRDLLDLKGQLMGMQPQASSEETPLIETQVIGEAPTPKMLPAHRQKSREMRELEVALMRIWSESEEMPASLRLERLSRIAQSLEEIRTGKQRIQKIEFDVIPLDQKTAIKIAAIAVIAIVMSLMGAMVFMPKSSQVQEIKAAVNGVNSRLIRVEKRLGTDVGK